MNRSTAALRCSASPCTNQAIRYTVESIFDHKKSRPIDRPLLLRLSDSYFTIDTIIATLQPYRKVGYIYEFVLDSALDFDLDDSYLLTLEELHSRKYDAGKYEGNLDEDEYAMKRKVLMRGQFDYEEYELGQITFRARSDAEEHYGKQQPTIYVKATDEAGLTRAGW